MDVSNYWDFFDCMAIFENRLLKEYLKGIGGFFSAKCYSTTRCN